MLSASVFALTEEALERGGLLPVSLALLSGGLFLYGVHAWTASGKREFAVLQLLGPRGWLVMFAMTVHSMPEGLAVGVGFATGHLQFGVLLALAIAIHNIPEGLAITVVLRRQGFSVLSCALLAIVSSLPQPLLAVPAYLLARYLVVLVPLGLAFAGGAMIYLSIGDLLASAHRLASASTVAWGFLLGLLAMLLMMRGLPF